jgi:hypothetical protein
LIRLERINVAQLRQPGDFATLVRFRLALRAPRSDTGPVMRRPRAGIVVGVVGLVLLGAGWWLAATGTAVPVGRPALQVARAQLRGVHLPGAQLPGAQLPGAHLPQPLLDALQRFLAGRGLTGALPPGVPPRPRTLRPPPRTLPSVAGRACPVAAGGFCSLTPCVVPVAAAPVAPCRAPTGGTQAVLISRPTALVVSSAFRPPTP